jgi:hypothetical protein
VRFAVANASRTARPATITNPTAINTVNKRFLDISFSFDRLNLRTHLQAPCLHLRSGRFDSPTLAFHCLPAWSFYAKIPQIAQSGLILHKI